MNTLVIGDVHGCLHELGDLIASASRIARIDRYVFAGDLVDRGPDSAGVIRLARSLPNTHLVRGNHDDRLMRFWRHVLDKNVSAIKEMNTFNAGDWVETIRQLGATDYHWLQKSTFWLELPEYNCIVVHGGIPEGIDTLPSNPSEVLKLSRKKRAKYEQMMYLRYVDPEGGFVRCYEEEPEDTFWAADYDGRFGHAFFGHTPHIDRHFRYKHATCLDGGLVFNGTLHGAILQEGEDPIIVTATPRS